MSSEISSEKIFHNRHGQLLTLREVVSEIQKYVSLHPESSYEVVVGSDSQSPVAGNASFVTAVVVRRIGNGGVYFWARTQEKCHNLRDRIWKETMRSVTLAQEFRSILREVAGEELFWEGRVEFRCIHLDVGEEGPTRELIDGVTGIVKGFGFVPVIKPFSYGAFVVADKHT